MPLFIAIIFILFLQSQVQAVDQQALSQALQLVTDCNPILATTLEDLKLKERKITWASVLTLGWTEKTTDQSDRVTVSDTGFVEERGGSAQFKVTIPLLSRTNQSEAVKVRLEYEKARETVLKAFLTEVSALHELSGKAKELDAMRKFYKEQLAYYQKAVEEGTEEPQVLWSLVEKFQQAEQAYQQATSKLDISYGVAARLFGGERWNQLQVMLVGLTK
jgi:tetratricopeptide (TPR) repeat protein